MAPRIRVTEPDVFFNRRTFIKAAAAVGAVGGLAGPMACLAQTAPDGPPVESPPWWLDPPFQRPGVFPAPRAATPALPSGVDTRLTPREVAGSNNNYYEFLPGGAGRVGPLTGKLVVDPWRVLVTGECAKPSTFDLDDLFAFDQQERLYHFRCVERWAMNVPWTGFPLRQLLEKVQPTSHAKYVRFTTANRPEEMPGLAQAQYYPWPYVEALRIDEAMHDLALLATGIYGRPLLKQHGAPVRLVVPWKYGYKNPKSIVKIELLREQPRTFWMMQPHEYGFLSNVNPNIPHPRWSQARSYWVDNPREWFQTPIFNGYAEQVASLYPDEPREPQERLVPGQIAR